MSSKVEAEQAAKRRPSFGLPPNACDAHCHVFGPAAVFPYAEGRRYTPEDAPKEAVGSLATRISHPVMVNLRFAGSPVRLEDMLPTQLPDLYAGEELVVFGRYEASGDAAGEISIVGTRQGREERFAARLA